MYIFSLSGIFILFLIYYLHSPLACLAVVSRSAFLPLGLEKLRITGQTYDPGLCFCYHSRHFPISFYCLSTHQQPHLPTNTLRRCQRPIIEDTHSSGCVCQLFGDQLQIKKIGWVPCQEKAFNEQNNNVFVSGSMVPCRRQLENMQHHSKAECVQLHYNSWDLGYGKCHNSSYNLKLFENE